MLGIDLGTSGVKVALVDLEGRPTGFASAVYENTSPEPGWAEIDPHVWEAAARDAVSDLIREHECVRIVGVGLDGQMHGVVLVDEAGDALMPALLWPDGRAEDGVRSWPDRLDMGTLRSLRNPLAAGMAGPLLEWVARQRPEVMAKARRALSPKDWLRSRLVFGSLVTDPSDASATLLWDVGADDWSLPLLAQLGLDVSLLPEVRPSSASAGTLDREAADRWSLPRGIPVTVGCGDVAATLLAVESADAESLVVIGSGAQAVLLGESPGIADAGRPRFHTYRAADERTYAMVTTSNAGLALSRVRAMLGLSWEELYDAPFAALERDCPVFLPFFAAERLPKPVGAGSASWQRLSASTTGNTLAASAVEGVLFGVCRTVATLPSAHGTVQVVGGGGRDPRVRQFLADVLERPILTRKLSNTTVVGAAYLALRMLGLSPDAFGGEVEILEPRDSRRARWKLFLDAVNA